MEKLDYFNTSPGLSYNGHRYFGSKVGGAFFIIVIILVTSVFIIFSKKFVEREKPKMTIEDYKFWSPPAMNMNDFKFIIMTKYSNMNQFYKNVLSIQAVYKKINYVNNTQEDIPLKEIPCLKEDFPGSEDQFDILQLSKGICLNTSGLTIEGSSVNSLFNYIYQFNFIYA
jgi:hypothetical protein